MAILHVRGVPADLVAQLRERAASERRSLGGEVIHLLQRGVAVPDQGEESARASDRGAEAGARGLRGHVGRALTPEEEAALWAEIDEHRIALAEKHGTFPDSAILIRADRDRDLDP